MIASHTVDRVFIAALLIGLLVDNAGAQALNTSSDLKVCTLNTCAMPAVGITVTRADGKPSEFAVGLEYDARSIRCNAGPSPDRLARNCGDDARVATIDGHEFIGIFGTPATVKLTLIDDEKVVATREFVPDYKISYPNGIECEPQCKNWKADWVIP